MQPTTSDLILQYLDQHPRSSARVISRFLNLTITDVRYHLQHLSSAGEVEAVSLDTAGSVGRPSVLYSRRRANSSVAVESLLCCLLESFPTADEADIHRLARALLPSDLLSSPSQVVRISKAVQYLDSLGCQARWEPRPRQPRVEFRRCPYTTLVERQPILCQIDRALLEVTSGCRVNRLQTSPCVFEIHLDEAIGDQKSVNRNRSDP